MSQVAFRERMISVGSLQCGMLTCPRSPGPPGLEANVQFLLRKSDDDDALVALLRKQLGREAPAEKPARRANRLVAWVFLAGQKENPPKKLAGFGEDFSEVTSRGFEVPHFEVSDWGGGRPSWFLQCGFSHVGFCV